MSAYAQAVIAFQKRIDLQLYNERMVTRVHELQQRVATLRQSLLPAFAALEKTQREAAAAASAPATAATAAPAASESVKASAHVQAKAAVVEIAPNAAQAAGTQGGVPETKDPETVLRPPP